MANDPSTGLTLWEAIEEWCSPALLIVRALARLKAEAAAALLRNAQADARLGPHSALALTDAAAAAHQAQAHVTQVEDRILAELKASLEAGKLCLRGVQTRPVPQLSATRIPREWATDLVFDLETNAVDFYAYRYVAVRAYPVIEREVLQIHVDGPDAENAVVDPVDTDDADGLSQASQNTLPKRGRGRENVGPLIAAVLLANWPEVQRQAAQNPEQQPVWSELARIVRNRFKKRHGPAAKIPHLDTIRTRLPEIYARILSDNPAG